SVYSSSSVLARLASEAFYETIHLVTPKESIHL
ncbi:MAG: hypothetical protein H6Q42_2246, partial [Deltaproteobacteria bacterium]|nr:hypothetical protein [Deltaproteobacteria bacterium]